MDEIIIKWYNIDLIMTFFETTSRVENPPTLPPSFKEPFSNELYDRAYSSMPADPFYDDEVKQRQAVAGSELHKLYEFPPAERNVPETFRTFMLEDYEIGEQRRQMENFKNYKAWAASNPEIPEEILPQLERYVIGRAEIEDVFDVAMHTEATGLEAGRISCGYWRRMEYVPELRAATAAAIEKYGGQLELRIMPYRSIDIEPHVVINEKGKQEIVGILAKYKHDIGQITREDGKIVHIVERQIAGVRVDEASGFPQEIIRKMQVIGLHEVKFRWDDYTHEDFATHLANSGCRGFVEGAIQTDSKADFFVPESTTVYLFTERPETARALGAVSFRNPDIDDGIAYYNSRQSGRLS